MANVGITRVQYECARGSGGTLAQEIFRLSKNVSGAF